MNAHSAYAFAYAAHLGQKYGGEPYITHLEEVVGVLRRNGFHVDSPVVYAGYLHDVVEDTPVTLDDIGRVFGGYIRRLVDALTDQPGKTRAERQARTYPRILATGFYAVVVKVADRIANVEHSLRNLQHSRGKLKMYVAEHQGFKRHLFHDDPNRLRQPTLLLMWGDLDNLIDEARRKLG